MGTTELMKLSFLWIGLFTLMIAFGDIVESSQATSKGITYHLSGERIK